MTRTNPSLLLPFLAIVALPVAACQTERKPLHGFDKPPPGIILGWEDGARVTLWPIFELPQQPLQIFHLRLNGEDAIVQTSNEGFYDYPKMYLQGWTAGYGQWITGVPPGSYVVELVDSAGQSWGQSEPLAIAPGNTLQDPVGGQYPAVILTHYEGQIGSWNVDPTTQDADPATDEITVTNLVDEDVVVERCLITNAGLTGCTPVGTVAPKADLLTVETLVPSSKGDTPALFVRLASDPSQSYERDLVQGAGADFGSSCQVERIIVHGSGPIPTDSYRAGSFAMSSCYGYGGGSSSF
jgi:hypothetical protein